MQGSFNFKVHAEVYQDEFGALAVRLDGEYVFRNLATRREEKFPDDILRELASHEHPDHWQDMPPHQLLYGRGWTCLARVGFIDGDLSRPAMELAVPKTCIQQPGQGYLAPLLEGQAA